MKDIAIALDALRELRVSLVNFGGRIALDVRIFATYRSTGEVGPTKAGVRLPLERLPELRRALETAERAAGEAGLGDERR